MTNQLRIYGASDDLIEFDGAIRDEFDRPSGIWQGRVLAPDGDGVLVTAEYTRRGTWAIGAAPLEDTRDGIGGKIPDWDLRITHADDCPYSAQLTMTVPDGVVVVEGSE